MAILSPFFFKVFFNPELIVFALKQDQDIIERLYLAWEYLGVPLDELQEVAGERWGASA